MNATASHDTTYTETFPRRAESAKAARRLVETALEGWELAVLLDDAFLVVSELVSNSVRHACAEPMRVMVHLVDERRVRVSVSDRSRVMPRLRIPGADELRGRGLPLIDELSDRWGTDLHPWGKRVWAELRAAGER